MSNNKLSREGGERGSWRLLKVVVVVDVAAGTRSSKRPIDTHRHGPGAHDYSTSILYSLQSIISYCHLTGADTKLRITPSVLHERGGSGSCRAERADPSRWIEVDRPQVPVCTNIPTS